MERIQELGPGFDTYVGGIGIEWPAEPWGREPGFLDGWPIRFYNDDGYVHTILHMDLHANADDVLHASLTMYAGEDGLPLFTLEGANFKRKAVFSFLITSMRHGKPDARNLTGEQQRAIDPRLRLPS